MSDSMASLAFSAQASPGRTVSRLRMWAGLVGLAALGLLISAPFLLRLLPEMLRGRHLPMPMGVVLLLQAVQVLVLAGLAAAVGVWTACA